MHVHGHTPQLPNPAGSYLREGLQGMHVHGHTPQVPIYEKGYGRDAAGIATDGISYAKQMGYDAVLVDTAGRMQEGWACRMDMLHGHAVCYMDMLCAVYTCYHISTSIAVRDDNNIISNDDSDSGQRAADEGAR